MISSSLNIQVICLLEKPCTHVTHPESSERDSLGKCWSERRKMHLTFDIAIVESICPHRSKAGTQPRFLIPKQRDERETDTPCLKQGSCFLNIKTTLEAAWIEKSKGITEKVGIELWRPKNTLLVQQLSFLLSSHGQAGFKSVADVHRQKSLNAPNSNPQQTLLP